MAAKLERIKLEEISGVDEPANAVPGWLLMKQAPKLVHKAGDPVRLTDGRVVGRVVGFGDGRVTVDWASDEIAALAKQACVEQHADGIYLVGGDESIGLGNALLVGRSVVLS